MTIGYSPSFSIQLLRNLPEADRPWFVAALRQDPLVWNSLQEPDLLQEASSLPDAVAQAWTPAFLAMTSITGAAASALETVTLLRSDLSHQLDKSLLRRVAQVLDSGFSPLKDETEGLPNSRDLLARAGLVALALRERRRMVGSWEGLIEELGNSNLTSDPGTLKSRWSTPLACLYGLVPDPRALLYTLSFQQVGSIYQDLALHALLSYPLSPDTQEQELSYLFEQLDIIDILGLLRKLSQQRPALASALAQKLLQTRMEEESANPVSLSSFDHLQRVKSLLAEAEACQIANDPTSASAKLSEARQVVYRVEAALSASQAQNNSRMGEHQGALKAWEKAVELTPNQDEARLYRAELAKAYLELGDPDDARRWLPDINSGPLTEQILSACLPARLTSARLEYQFGDRDLAYSQASGLLDAITSSQSDQYLAGLPELANLLLALDDPDEAEQAVELALAACPANPELLVLSAEVKAAAGRLDEAAAAVQIAAAMQPGQIELRRKLAGFLEASGEWETAVAERRAIVENNQEDKPLDDWLALARCSLSAGYPKDTIEYALRFMEFCQDESKAIEAHLLLAEAYNAQGEQQLAYQHFNQVTQSAPHRPGPWLGLARLQKENGQAKRALDTLLAAAQAASTSPEVQLALGEAYLADWEGHGHPALSQALAAFRKANQLVPVENCKSETGLLIALRFGNTLHQLGHHDEARQVLEAAYKEKPTIPGLAHSYGTCLLALNQAGMAITPLERATRQDPHNSQVHLDYGRALLKEGSQPGEAAHALQRAFELDPACWESKALFAEALNASGDQEGALLAYQQMIGTTLMEDLAWNARIALGMARTALALRQPDTAVSVLAGAVQKAPNDPGLARALSDAYQEAGQISESIEQARTAVCLAVDDVNVLAWFGEKAIRWLTLAATSADKASPQPISWDTQLQLRVEALNALGHALELAPYRNDLRVLLGRVQFLAGDTEEALATFHQVAREEFASPHDLHQAAQYLLLLNDAPGAAACLERALRSVREKEAGEGTQDAELELAGALVTAYEKASNLDAALTIVEQALVLEPLSVSLLGKKAGLLMEMGRSQEALSCLETGIALQPGNKLARQLHYRTALILRSMGRLPSALAHAEKSLAASQQTPVDVEAFQARLLAADLARAMLQLKQARAFLEVQPVFDTTSADPESSEDSNIESVKLAEGMEAAHPIDYLCLRAELDLELCDEAQAASALEHALLLSGQTSVEDMTAGRLRLNILEARIKARQGDLETALKIFQESISKEEWNFGEGAYSQVSQLPPLNNNGASLLKNIDQASNRSLLAVAEAGLEFGHWDIALYLLRQACDTAPMEPLSFIKLARGLVQRAEAQHICHELNIVNHAPGQAASSRHAGESFESAVATANQLIDHWRVGEVSEVEICSQSAYAELAHWKARGELVFNPSLENAAALAGLPYFGDNSAKEAAYVAGLLHISSIQPSAYPAAVAAAIQATRNHPQNPQVLATLAQVLSADDENLADALKAARQAVRYHLAKPETLKDAPLPLPPIRTALYNVLLAQLGHKSGAHERAKEAVLSSLAVWPNEPRWLNLAGEINIALSNLPAATTHLEQAIVLEPRHIPHYLALGRAYLSQPSNERAGGSSESSSLGRAIHALDQACSLAPEQVEPWLALSRAYQSARDLDRAAACAEKALELSPQLTQPLLVRGEIALAAGDYKLAYDHIQTVLHSLPSDNEQVERDPDVILLLSRALDGLGQPEDALKAVEKAIHVAEEPLSLLIERVKLLEKTAGDQQAMSSLLELGQHYPDSPQVLALLAEKTANTGQTETAVNHAQHALQIVSLQPEDRQELSLKEQSDLHCLLGELLRKSGQLDQSIHHLNEAINQTPFSIDAYIELGLAYQDRRQHTQAIQVYQKAAGFAPYDPRPYLHAGLALRETKDYLAAEDMLRRAADLAPADLTIHRQLGAVVALNLVHNRRKRSGDS